MNKSFRVRIYPNEEQKQHPDEFVRNLPFSIRYKSECENFQKNS